MSRMNAKSLQINRLGGARSFVVFLAAIGLLLQSYVTQTHIHFGPPDTGAVSQTVSDAGTPAKGPLDKAAGCPLCQAIVHAGAFVAPSAPVVTLSFSWVRTARLAFAALPTLGDIAHDWRSRAPPHG
jgi:hypothetical protein